MPHSYSNADDITLLSLKKELEGYSWAIFRQDFLAAVSVALLTVPQAMAYALLAGLPLSAGLFAAIYSALIAAVFGSSRHLYVGPSNAIAILLQAGTSEILFTYYRGLEGPEREIAAMQILTQLCLLVGMIQALAAGCKLGRLTQFVSHSVIVAFITGTALAIVVNQLFTFTGISNTAQGDSIYDKAFYFATHLHEVHWPTLVVGAWSLLLLIMLKRIDKRIPAPLIALILTAVIVHFFANYSFEGVETESALQKHWQDVLVVGDTGNLSEILPKFAFPYFDIGLLNHLLPFALAVALLSILETTSIAKTIAASSGQRLSINQEIFGVGLGNLFSALISAMPVSGNVSRSCLSYSLGGQTRMAAIATAGIVGSIIFCFSFLIMHVPLATLSALLLVSAVTIVNTKQFFLCVKATNSDAFVLWITLVSCVFLSLDIALYIGIFISITLYLKKAAIPQLVEYDIDDDGELHNLNYSNMHEQKTIRVIKVDGELFFGAADLFQTTLKTIAEDDTSTKVIILQLKNARDIDATACLALEQLYEYLKGSGRYLVACGMTQQVWDVLSDSGLIELIGKEYLFIFDERHPHLHMLKALNKARKLVEVSVPETAMEPEGDAVTASVHSLQADSNS